MIISNNEGNKVISNIKTIKTWNIQSANELGKPYRYQTDVELETGKCKIYVSVEAIKTVQGGALPAAIKALEAAICEIKSIEENQK